MIVHQMRKLGRVAVRAIPIAVTLALTVSASSHAQSSAPASLLTFKLALNLNQTNTDNAVTVSVPKYIIRRIVVTNASVSLAANLATLGVFTGAGGTGTTVVALTLVQGLTGATKFVDTTIAVTADRLTASTLFIRNGVTAGTAATVDVYIFGDVLP